MISRHLNEFGAQNELFPLHLKGSENAAAHVICEKKLHNRREAGKQPRAQLPGMEDAVVHSFKKHVSRALF